MKFCVFNGFNLKYMNYISTLRQSYILCSEIYFSSARGVSRGGWGVCSSWFNSYGDQEKRHKFGMQDRIFRTNVNPGLLFGPFPECTVHAISLMGLFIFLWSTNFLIVECCLYINAPGYCRSCRLSMLYNSYFLHKLIWLHNLVL